eukprot:5991181-Amphidinium_carterae.1
MGGVCGLQPAAADIRSAMKGIAVAVPIEFVTVLQTPNVEARALGAQVCMILAVDDGAAEKLRQSGALANVCKLALHDESDVVRKAGTGAMKMLLPDSNTDHALGATRSQIVQRMVRMLQLESAEVDLASVSHAVGTLVKLIEACSMDSDRLTMQRIAVDCKAPD